MVQRITKGDKVSHIDQNGRKWNRIRPMSESDTLVLIATEATHNLSLGELPKYAERHYVHVRNECAKLLGTLKLLEMGILPDSDKGDVLGAIQDLWTDWVSEV